MNRLHRTPTIITLDHRAPRRRLQASLKALLLLVTALLSPWAHAWGAEGHRIVGLIADTDIGPKTRIATRRILGGANLADEAVWMDEVRNTPVGRRMSKWHYVNLDLCTSPNPRICADGNCAPAKIETAIEVLRAGQHSATDPEQMRTALRVLVHLVGDIHQPLHAADNHDGGGNGVLITNRSCGSLADRPGASCKLHAYWDSTLVKGLTRGASESQRAQQWASSFGPLPASDSQAPWEWTRESHALARQSAYNFGPSTPDTCGAGQRSVNVSSDYDHRASVTVQQRLTLAGKRLARLLNDIYER